MFNNAGIAWGGDTELLTLEQWNAIIDVNIRGVVHGVTAAYPVMLRQGHGFIVNTASMAGLAAAGQITSYVMTKHAIVGLSLALRSEAVPRGVGVLAVCPGAVETPILDKGAIGGFAGRDYYLRGQGMKNAYSADRLARDTLKAIGRNKGLLVKPKQEYPRPGCSPGWRRVCCSVCRFDSSPISASGHIKVSRQAARVRFYTNAEGRR